MTTRLTIALAAALALAGLGAAPGAARAEDEPFGRLDVGQVEALLGAADVRIYDVNSMEVYARGHVPGATWASLSGLEKRLPADKTLRLVFYCKNGH
jgi:hypothetical protein